MSMDPFDWVFPEGHVNWGVIFLVIGTPIAITFACYGMAELWRRCMAWRRQCLPYQQQYYPGYGMYGGFSPPGTPIPPLVESDSSLPSPKQSSASANSAQKKRSKSSGAGYGPQRDKHHSHQHHGGGGGNCSVYSESIGYGSLHGNLVVPLPPPCPPPRPIIMTTRCSVPNMHTCVEDEDYCATGGASVYASPSSSTISSCGESITYGGYTPHRHHRHHQMHDSHSRGRHCYRGDCGGCSEPLMEEGRSGRCGNYHHSSRSRRCCVAPREQSVYYGRCGMSGSGAGTESSTSGGYYDYVDEEYCQGGRCQPQRGGAEGANLNAGNEEGDNPAAPSPQFNDSGMVSGEATTSEDPPPAKVNPPLLKACSDAMKMMGNQIISDIVSKPKEGSVEEGELKDDKGVNTSHAAKTTKETNTTFVRYPSATNTTPKAAGGSGNSGFGGNKGFSAGINNYNTSTPKANGLNPTRITTIAAYSSVGAKSSDSKPTATTTTVKRTYGEKEEPPKPKTNVTVTASRSTTTTTSAGYGYRNTRDSPGKALEVKTVRLDDAKENRNGVSSGYGGRSNGGSAATSGTKTVSSATSSSSSIGNKGFGNAGFSSGGGSNNKPSAPVANVEEDEESEIDEFDRWARREHVW